MIWNNAVTAKKIIPVTYVDYIESNGEQYIDTGVIGNQDIRLVIDLDITKQGTYPVFGARIQAAQASFSLWEYVGSDGRVFRSDYGTRQNASEFVESQLGRRQFDKNKNVLQISPDGLTVESNTQSFTSNCPILLLTLNQENGGVDYRKMSARLYSCQVYENNQLLRDFWPCIDPEGVACVYDRCRNLYVYNAGTGAFSYG